MRGLADANTVEQSPAGSKQFFGVAIHGQRLP